MTNKEFRNWRRSQEITQQEIADTIHCNKSTICRWEKNQIELNNNLYEKILNLYSSGQICPSVTNKK